MVPILVALIVFGMSFAGLAGSKLKLQEATRFLAWEVTSYPLAEAGAAGDGFERARIQILSEAHRRFPELGVGEPWLGPTEWHGRVTQRDAVGTLASYASRVGLNPAGAVSSATHATVQPGKLGPQFLGPVFLESSMELIGSDWHLPDGLDALMHRGRAGRRPGSLDNHGLYERVKKALWLGQTPRNVSAGSLSQFLPIPAQEDAYDESRNYQPSISQSSCRGWPGFPSQARNGQNDLSAHPTLDSDSESEACFDTAPFRDTHEYSRSLYARMFQARGPYFLGCARPGALDSSSRVECGGSP
jgi:hypothetical protein